MKCSALSAGPLEYNERNKKERSSTRAESAAVSEIVVCIKRHGTLKAGMNYLLCMNMLNTVRIPWEAK